MAPSAGVSIGWDRLYGRSLQCHFLPFGDEDLISSCSRWSRCLPQGQGRKEGRKGRDGGAAGTWWDPWAQVAPTVSNSGCVVVEVMEPAWKIGLRGYLCGSRGAAWLPAQRTSLSQSPGFINDQ